MQVEFLVNDSVSLLLAPENEMEEALLKQMMKQKNDIVEIRTAVNVLNKTYRNGILMGKRTIGSRHGENHIDSIDNKDNEEETKEV
jgi:hypothetical protein